MPTPPEGDAATVRERIVAANDATYAAWNAHDADAVAAVFAETAVVRDLGSPDVARGRDAVRERARTLLAAFPDFSLERIELLVDEAENANADRWLARGDAPRRVDRARADGPAHRGRGDDLQPLRPRRRGDRRRQRLGRRGAARAVGRRVRR